MGGETFATAGAGEAGNFAAMTEGGAMAAGGGVAETSLGALALPVAAGALLGGAVVYGMEKTGLLGLTGKGAVRSAGEETGRIAYNAGRSFGDFVLKMDNVVLSKDYALADLLNDAKKASRDRASMGYETVM